MPSRPNTGRIPLEELASLPSFYLPTVAHDRRQIAFYSDHSGALELYVMPPEAGAEPRQISHGELPRSIRAGYVWAWDGRTIYFAKDNAGDEQHNLWRIDLATSHAEQLTDTPTAQEYPEAASPDGRTLYIRSDKDDQMNVYAFDLEARTYHRLTFYRSPVFTMILSDDGRRIAYTANETGDLLNTDVYVMNADGSEPRRVLRTRIGAQDEVSDWSADGRLLAVGSDASGWTRTGVLEPESGALRWLSPDGQNTLPGKFSPDGTKLLAYRNADSAVSVVVYDVRSGEPIPVSLPPGLAYDADWLDDDRFMVNIQTDRTRPELWAYRLSDGQSAVLLPARYGSIDPALFVGHEYVRYPSTDGTPIPAIVYRPRDRRPGERHPAIVHIHGGPTGQFFRGFDVFAQFLADRGIVVIEPNPRGSSGYGVEFRDACLKDWAGKDLEDIEGAVNYLRSQPDVDPARIGVFGGSYGGYMTYMAMTKKPDLWKAGVAWVGITDLHLLYEGSMEHFKYYLRQQMGDPEQDAGLWRDRSAIHFADRLRGKLLIVHGTNDPRCPLNQATTFRDRLLELGRVEGEDFEYVELSEEGHGSTDIGQKIRTYTLLADFMARRL